MWCNGNMRRLERWAGGSIPSTLIVERLGQPMPQTFNGSEWGLTIGPTTLPTLSEFCGDSSTAEFLGAIKKVWVQIPLSALCRTIWQIVQRRFWKDGRMVRHSSAKRGGGKPSNAGSIPVPSVERFGKSLHWADSSTGRAVDF